VIACACVQPLCIIECASENISSIACVVNSCLKLSCAFVKWIECFAWVWMLGLKSKSLKKICVQEWKVGWSTIESKPTQPIAKNTKFTPLQLNRLAVTSLPPGDNKKIDLWEDSSSHALGGNYALVWWHTRKMGYQVFYWYIVWRSETTRQAAVLRSTDWAIFKSVSGWPISPPSSPTSHSRLAPFHSHTLTLTKP